MRRAITFFLFWILFAGFILGLFGLTYWYWHSYRTPVTVRLASDQLMGPRDALTIHFSQMVQPQSLVGAISLEPGHRVRAEWSDHQQTLRLIPEEHWPLQSRFRLTIASGKTFWFGSTPQVTFTITGPQYPSIVATTPLDHATDVLLGIEDPVEVVFDRSAKDLFIDFRLTPPAEMVYRNNPEKTTFEILPKDGFQTGKHYSIAMFAKWRGSSDDTYQFLGQTSFATASPPPAVRQSDLPRRTDEALRSTVAKRTDGKYIDINLSRQVMTLFENGQALDAYVISSGKRGMETPRGEFAIENKANRPWSKQYRLYMPYWQAITPDGKFGIHELPEWPGGYKEGANHLGTPVSHGCVRLGVGAAARVYAWSDIGTPIVIY